MGDDNREMRQRLRLEWRPFFLRHPAAMVDEAAADFAIQHAASEVKRDREEVAKQIAELERWKREQQHALIHLSCALMDAGLVKSHDDDCIDVAVAAAKELDKSRATVARLEQELAAARTVFAVAFGNYGPDEIDSVWGTKEDAEARCAELDGDWRVRTIEVQSLTAQRVEPVVTASAVSRTKGLLRALDEDTAQRVERKSP